MSYSKRRELESEQQRQALKTAADYCYSQKGYRKTSVAAVARHPGASKGLVFHFF